MRRDERRVMIEACRPVVDCGRYAAKGTVGVGLAVGADVFSEGHDPVLAWARFGPRRAAAAPPEAAHRGWTEVPLTQGFNDRFTGWVVPTRRGEMAVEFVGVVDDFGAWLHGLQAKFDAAQAIDVELEEGARLAAARSRRRSVGARDRAALLGLAKLLRDGRRSTKNRVRTASSAVTRRLMTRTADRSAGTVAGPFAVWVDRTLGGFSAWYEMFPRSEGAQPPHSGTLQTAARRLPAIAAMGFDIVYLPPIHPIGVAFRKGADNSLTAAADDVGSPWAIGGEAGGHTAVHPDLGTLDDFDRFVDAARHVGLEVALDYAIQCSPDHPWVTEHPDWFSHRPDGTIKYAENPPKRYQDVYPINFQTRDRTALWHALRDVVLFWCDHGVRVFRVDNPHTKPLRFWEWLIAEVRRRHPDTLFLAEAFTRPRVMHSLAKAGFTQSYTYFTWRTSKWELSEYLTELRSGPGADYFRANFWPNTPDILHASLQHGGPAAFRLRLILAAFGAASWGMYSGYELHENAAVAGGGEEYLHSEKYQLRPRDWDRADSMAPLITHVNGIRRRHFAAIAQPATLALHHIDNDHLLCFSRTSHDGTDRILVIVNLDPHQAQEGTTWLDLDALGMPADRPYEAHDEITGTTYMWQGPANYIRLDPQHLPAHILHLRNR